jgi:hypothetical protein
MTKKILDWQKKRNQRVKLYAKVVRAVRKEFKSQKIELTYEEAREYASKNVYPKFKGQPAYKVKVKDIREATRESLAPAPAPVPPQKQYVDPRTIGEEEVSGINWFDIDGFLTGDLSPSIRQVRALRTTDKDLRMMILAGEYGNTGEFNLSDYEYVSTGLQDIVEEIRRTSPSVSSEPYLTWEGYVGIRAGATDLTDPDSYVFQIILIENNQPVVEPSTITTLPPQRIQTPEDVERLREEQRQRLKDERERQKAKEEAEKRKARKSAKRPTTKKRVKEPKVSVPEPPAKLSKRETKAQQVIRLNEIRLRELELLRAEFDDKLISKAKYNRQKAQIMKNYEEAFKKLRAGGII